MMNSFIDIFWLTIKGSFNWFVRSVVFDVPWYLNYFWGLIVISFVVWGLELLFPWRKTQAVFRKDFWLDGFYMFFNFFLFSISVSGLYALFVQLFYSLGGTISLLAIIPVKQLPVVAQLLVFFVLLDFVQWATHIALHKFPLFWSFHKIHHSVKEMGFAAHLRYHWMENILYKPLKTIAVLLLGGFEPEQAYIVHFVAIIIGHLNHANLKLTYGPFKYVFNNPVMHLYHHAYELPKGKFGVNFGISLSLWDYLFKTNYMPEDSGAILLGFPKDEMVPKTFWKQLISGFK